MGNTNRFTHILEESEQMEGRVAVTSTIHIAETLVFDVRLDEQRKGPKG